jgi:hypothetical protein
MIISWWTLVKSETSKQTLLKRNFPIIDVIGCPWEQSNHESCTSTKRSNVDISPDRIIASLHSNLIQLDYDQSYPLILQTRLSHMPFLTPGKRLGYQA